LPLCLSVPSTLSVGQQGNIFIAQKDVIRVLFFCLSIYTVPVLNMPYFVGFYSVALYRMPQYFFGQFIIFPDNIKQLTEDIKNIDNVAIRAKLFVEIGKLFVPHPLNKEETQSHELKNKMIKRMMDEK
jgi:hypothetical protein